MLQAGRFSLQRIYKDADQNHRQCGELFRVHLLVEDRNAENRDVNIACCFQYRPDVERYALVGQHRLERAAHKEGIA